MCRHLTRGECRNEFEIFISSCETGSESRFQTGIQAAAVFTRTGLVNLFLFLYFEGQFVVFQVNNQVTALCQVTKQ